MTAGQAAVAAAARMLPIAIVAPPLGRGVAARLVAGGLLTALVWPAVRGAGAPVTPALIFRELLVGLTLALVASVPFRAAEAAGALTDHARSGTTPGVARRPLAEAYGLLALALFAALSGPRLMVAALADSYAAFPVGGLPSVEGGLTVATEAAFTLIGSAVALAAPALAALLLAELVAGLAVRAQPALAQAVGMASMRTLVTIAVVGLGLLGLASGLRLGGLSGAMSDSLRILGGR